MVLEAVEKELVEAGDYCEEIYCSTTFISIFPRGGVQCKILSMPERFISEPIKPLTETADTSRMALGEPGLPRGFVWRGRTVTLLAVLRSWRENGKCRHGGSEMYVRKHWYEVDTVSNGIMKIYFERRTLGGRRRGARWWLFSVREAE